MKVKVLQYQISVSSHNATMLRGLPHHATTVTCPNCQGVVSTRVDHEANGKTHCWACCLFCFLYVNLI
jgi:LITAF-like zinc ribbon domain